MITQADILHGAILKPEVKKALRGCDSYFRVRRHSYADMSDGQREQCLDCGRVKWRRQQNVIHQLDTGR